MELSELEDALRWWLEFPGLGGSLVVQAVRWVFRCYRSGDKFLCIIFPRVWTSSGKSWKMGSLLSGMESMRGRCCQTKTGTSSSAPRQWHELSLVKKPPPHTLGTFSIKITAFHLPLTQRTDILLTPRDPSGQGRRSIDGEVKKEFLIRYNYL
ncbi:hypothetical protein HNY73_022866 [Argiope bruennichi]|uniref:Uncharacterized protein n=1 Tax=Argiope bruennichi TaxID=94029 RepID=A0A8T0E316_ARGBR|nr:hypothetical protein HNY73_022866 [Argiope bruennichi]